MNTHESYVSLETAKLLKHAGFDWECFGYYNKLGFFHRAIPHNGELSAPTLDVAQRWLREVKGYSIYVTRGGYKIYILDENDSTGFSRTYELNSILPYEEALEAGIKKCLEIILENK